MEDEDIEVLNVNASEKKRSEEKRAERNQQDAKKVEQKEIESNKAKNCQSQFECEYESDGYFR